ncbi:DUF6603 domain-containing protein [Allokutzneria albata]|uniref:DUF6603 domain-containing protein n=1 Tax=Allokutzneria albata TaxID=211114 RepID=A0A1G9S7L2_ALLAB|nr:DUF6603 domain-containing protein [Allokutzneria albata]SDM31456.1 hypothetical protein SAMN04489726_0948 [Allokutzneria albata]
MALSLQELLDLFPQDGEDFRLPLEELREIPGVGELLATWLGSADLTVRSTIADTGSLSVQGIFSFTVVEGPCPIEMSFTVDALNVVSGVSLDFTLPASEEDSGEEDSFAPHLVLTAMAGGVLTAALVLKFAGADGEQKEMEFSATYGEGTLSGIWESEDGVSWDDIAHALDSPPADLPPELVPVLTSVGFVYAKRKKAFVFAAKTEYVALAFASLPQKAGTGVAGPRLRMVLLEGVASTGLSDLPTVGDHVPLEEDLIFGGLQAFHLSAAMTVRKVKALNELLAEVNVQLGLPVRALTAGASVAATVAVAGVERTYGLVYPIRRRQKPPTPPPRTETTAEAEDVPAVASIALQVEFGPLRLYEIGLSYEDGTARITVGATLDAGGIELSAAELGFAITLGEGDWSFRPTLSGLGLSFDRKPIRIGGAFLAKQADPPYDMLFAGMAVIEAQVVSVKVLGAYARAEGGYPSLFLYGVLAGKRGIGPPPFQVRGIAAGFGYNSSVRVPAPAETPYFPLVGELGGHTERPPLEVLDDLLDGAGGQAPWLTPALGQIWFALGVDFTVFQLVDAQVLAMVEFGEDFTAALLGLATASFPVRRGSGPTYARVQLAMQALYTSADGMLALAAELTPESFVLDPECRLRGGLAYRTWFSGAHEGDFVFSLGGYHRDFDAPDHYPVVPRLGYTWGISNCVTVRGEAYCALTPSAFMVGGRLEVAFHSGIVDAWLIARLDALIQWKPFHFRLGIGVRIGFSVDLWLFTVSGEVGVDLDLWGPPVGGIATVHLWCIDFDVSFGADRDNEPDQVLWSDVQEQLPAREELLRITPLTGILPEDEDVKARRARAGDDRWVVSAAGFSFSTFTAVPASTAEAGGTLVEGGKPLDVRPMGEIGLTSAHTLRIKLGDDNDFDLEANGWTLEAVTANVPEALWGKGDPDQEGTEAPPLVEDQVTGMKIVVPPPAEHGTARETDDVALGVDLLDPAPSLPITPGDEATGPLPRPGEPGTIGVIAAGIAESTVAARDALYAELGTFGVAPAAANDRLPGFATRAQALFTAEPMTL